MPVRNLFDHQLGVATRSQLYAAGVSPSTVRRAVRSGELVDVLRGIVRPASYPDRRESELMAAQLYLGPGSYITGSTAARMQGLLAMPARPLRFACRERCRAALPGW